MTFEEALDELARLVDLLSTTVDEIVSQLALMDARVGMIDEDVRKLNSQM
jgi:hypothetical protein